MNDSIPPLEGVRVLDFTRVLAGPFCSMILGDLGAEVIKVEIPGRGDDTRGYPPFIDGASSYFLSINRNKKSITLNLKTPEGQDVAHDLASKCDVVLENFRPGVTKRLGVDYDSIKKYNPKLIYASISSFGQTGPYANLPGYDLIVQGMGGLMGLTGEPGRPPVRIGVAITDIGAGMWAAIAILAALNHRKTTERGQYIDISMLDGSASWMTYAAGNYFATGKAPPKMGSAHPSIVPYQGFIAQDGKSILIASGNDRLFQMLCGGIGLDNLPEDERFKTNDRRVENREELIQILEKEFLKRSRDEWVELLRPLGFPCGPVYTLDELFSDKHLIERGMLKDMKHPRVGTIKQVGPTIKFSETPCQMKYPPPTIGQHTEDILRNLLGYGKEDVGKLKEKGAI